MKATIADFLWKFTKDPTHLRDERLTAEEHKQHVRRMPHTLEPEEMEARCQIMRQQALIDYQWGFYNGVRLAPLRRAVYSVLVHPIFYRKRKLPSTDYP